VYTYSYIHLDFAATHEEETAEEQERTDIYVENMYVYAHIHVYIRVCVNIYTNMHFKFSATKEEEMAEEQERTDIHI